MTFIDIFLYLILFLFSTTLDLIIHNSVITFFATFAWSIILFFRAILSFFRLRRELEKIVVERNEELLILLATCPISEVFSLSFMSLISLFVLKSLSLSMFINIITLICIVLSYLNVKYLEKLILT